MRCSGPKCLHAVVHALLPEREAVDVHERHAGPHLLEERPLGLRLVEELLARVGRLRIEAWRLDQRCLPHDMLYRRFPQQHAQEGLDRLRTREEEFVVRRQPQHHRREHVHGTADERLLQLGKVEAGVVGRVVNLALCQLFHRLRAQKVPPHLRMESLAVIVICERGSTFSSPVISDSCLQSHSPTMRGHAGLGIPA